MIFPKNLGGGVLIGKMREWEASIDVTWYTNDSSILIRHIICLVSIFSFSDFRPDLFTTVWRSLQTPFSSNFICKESSGCLVSNGPCLGWFGAMVIKISCSEGRWCKIKKFLTSFLEKFISFNPKLISSSPFGESWLRPYYSRQSILFIPTLS